MTESFKKIFFSTRLTAVLFIVFAIAMAFGTFIENWYSTATARIWIYNTAWFEAIIVFFVINFIGNIYRYNLLKKEKWAILLLHLSFILIITGAFITRYISYEGMMPIREGETENTFFSDNTFLTVYIDGEIDGEVKRKLLQDKILVTEQAIKSTLPWKSDFNGKPVKIEHVGFIEGAEEGLIEDENGEEYLKIVEAGGGERHDHYLKSGDISSIHNILFALNKHTPGAINITTTDSVYTIQSPFEGKFMRMADQYEGELIKDSIQPLMLRSLYSTAGMQFVFPEDIVKGKYGVVKTNSKGKSAQDALILKISANGEEREVKVLGSKGTINPPKQITIGELDFNINYGSLSYQLPFSIKLNDFIAEKYPGTEKGYSSYKSKITVMDERPFDYDIFMNHILDHKGYRFFQASFHPDEKGTILSVNHDFWGTWMTYLGYFLLYAGLMGIMFFGDTRFKKLGVMLKKVRDQKTKLASLILLLLSFSSFSQHSHSSQGDTHQMQIEAPSESYIDSVLQQTLVPSDHAEKFGKLVLQDNGRMKPVNTFASELLRKMSKKDTYKNMDANQFLLSVIQNPGIWYYVNFMYLKKGNDSIRKIIGVESNSKYVRVIDFLDERLNNKLEPYLDEAYATNTPNQFQKDFKNSYERLWLFNSAQSGEMLKIYPLPEDENNKWISSVDLLNGTAKVKDSLYANFIRNSIPYYLMTLREAKVTGNYDKADKILEAFKKNQANYGGSVLPSDKKIDAEVFYNKYDIFKKLFSWYMYAGTLMFILLIVQIFNGKKWIDISVKVLKFIIIGLFILHTAGLIVRWYVSGHAPWSDAYESMIYVAWATMGMGLLFAKKSDLTIASTAFVVSMILMIAHWQWMDPAIANLQPVLNSYWLMIHVSIIVGSYGPFTLGMILGVVALLLMILTNKENKAKMKLNIEEITIINELALTVGLIMLTIGNFLGGQWANESWGRYWGWDPKETWALISIMVYAFVVHMRLVPGLRGKWMFNFFSIIAYASIMMTYFGVNFYLTGLHSYASGDKIITPAFVWYTVLGVLLLGGISYWRYKLNFKKT
ncbi:cytochrome c biogenesis protein CcsA [Abyssalbus ytuae]|uniref:Cytochrome c biogenesis protein CcsA n=1 Tax=Abyssalbus ytuae TaxID=2926907 RepID=A0A9E6ZKA7_9FLAO|nr:cytochrome c biogenesis protein CcsA [Abyssalbus ytuae]UOB17252.1 cytochrome c biogenesis protein CcsA [Abyssalbus ytuae]